MAILGESFHLHGEWGFYVAECTAEGEEGRLRVLCKTQTHKVILIR